MSEMIERVARAMHRALDADPRFVGRADLSPEHPAWAQYLCQARAAIAALREPTESMLAAGCRAIGQHSSEAIMAAELSGVRYAVPKFKMTERWYAMIDSALSPDDPA